MNEGKKLTLKTISRLWKDKLWREIMTRTIETVLTQPAIINQQTIRVNSFNYRIYVMLILCILLFSSAAYSQNQGVKLEIIRSYYALDEDKPDDMLKRHGDYLYFRELEEGGTAGFL
jgi:hypothetical protein